MRTITQEAEDIVKGQRAKSYGDSSQSLINIASVWSVILKTKITPEQVAMCMIGLKLVRESVQHKRDNLVDMVGYEIILDKYL